MARPRYWYFVAQRLFACDLNNSWKGGNREEHHQIFGKMNPRRHTQCFTRDRDEACGWGQFSCAKPGTTNAQLGKYTRCIPDVWYCDGIQDCVDNSDEASESCLGTKKVQLEKARTELTAEH